MRAQPDPTKICGVTIDFGASPESTRPPSTTDSGRTVVFLHRWGLVDRTYRAVLAELEALGLLVHAPTMPGFGGTTGFPSNQTSIRGYAAWVADYVRSLDTDGPVILIGHSFGGGVAAMTAHETPELVSEVIMINAVGGTRWHDADTMANRPLWQWALHLQLDLLPTPENIRVLPAVLRDAIPAAIANPLGLWRASRLARTADLTRELATISDRGLPVISVWSHSDSVITAAATAELRAAHHRIRAVDVAGGHCWLLADPHRFGRLISQVLSVSNDSDAMRTRPHGRRTQLPA